MTEATLTATIANRPRFDEDAGAILRRLRGAFNELVAAVPGDIRRAADLQRALGIDSKLGWQVFRVVNSDNPVDGGLDVPPRTSVRRLLQAATKRSVPKTIITRTAEAFDAFESMVEHHAGDRQTFQSMLCAIAQQEQGQIYLQHRRAAFAAASHILGVQARTRFACHIFKPGTNPDSADVVFLCGYADLRWLRADHVPFVLSRVRSSDNDGVCRSPTVHEPLDPIGRESTGVSLLTDFCTGSAPQIRQRQMSGGFVHTELVGQEVGKPSASTYVIGEVMRNGINRFRIRPEQGPFIELAGLIRTPCEVMFHDLLVHEGTYPELDPRVLTYTDHQGVDPSTAGREGDLLPLKAEVKHLGRGAEILHTRDVPRYAEMIRYALDRVGWDGQRFDVYRCRVEYPIMPSSVVVRFDLPEAPTAGPATESHGSR